MGPPPCHQGHVRQAVQFGRPLLTGTAVAAVSNGCKTMLLLAMQSRQGHVLRRSTQLSVVLVVIVRRIHVCQEVQRGRPLPMGTVVAAASNGCKTMLSLAT